MTRGTDTKTDTSHMRSVGCGIRRARGHLSVAAMAMATLSVVCLSPGAATAAASSWHRPNLGNALVEDLCRSKQQPMFCWEPHFWTSPWVIGGKGQHEMRKVTGQRSEFWSANGNGPSMSLPPVPGPDEGELPDSAMHLRCGDVTMAADTRLCRHPCRSCITESIRSWLREGWDNATSTAWLVVGGHPSLAATTDEKKQGRRRCNDCACSPERSLHSPSCPCLCRIDVRPAQPHGSGKANDGHTHTPDLHRPTDCAPCAPCAPCA